MSLFEADIKLIIYQTQCTRERAIQALENHPIDLLACITEIRDDVKLEVKPKPVTDGRVIEDKGVIYFIGMDRLKHYMKTNNLTEEQAIDRLIKESNSFTVGIDNHKIQDLMATQFMTKHEAIHQLVQEFT